jgi:hypothetical protein
VEIFLVLLRREAREEVEVPAEARMVVAVVNPEVEIALEVLLATEGAPAEVEPFINVKAIWKADRRIFREEICTF